jgi:hypothetical protein
MATLTAIGNDQSLDDSQDSDGKNNAKGEKPGQTNRKG